MDFFIFYREKLCSTDLLLGLIPLLRGLTILKALMLLGIVKEEQILYRVLIPVAEHLLPFAEVIPCESESDSDSESDDGKSDDENSVTDEGSREKNTVMMMMKEKVRRKNKTTWLRKK